MSTLRAGSLIAMMVILLLLQISPTTTSFLRQPPLPTSSTAPPRSLPLPPLFVRAYQLLSSGNFLFDRVSPELRSTEITLRGLYSYTMKLDQECQSDTGAVVRLGTSVTNSVPTLTKFQRLAGNTLSDVLSARKVYSEINLQRKQTKKQTRSMCTLLQTTLTQWIHANASLT
jgi:hypothetical protein